MSEVVEAIADASENTAENTNISASEYQLRRARQMEEAMAPPTPEPEIDSLVFWVDALELKLALVHHRPAFAAFHVSPLSTAIACLKIATVAAYP